MSIEKVIALKQLLQEKFPAAQSSVQQKPSLKLSTGLPAIDQLGLPTSGLSELSVGTSNSSGIGLVLAFLLKSQASSALPLALVDYRSSCDVQSLGADCERLLWIRCSTPYEALQCADLLLHDANLPLILIDLLLLTPRESRQIPLSSWRRIRQLSEQNGCALLALSQNHLIPCAHFHCKLENRIELDELQGPIEALSRHLIPNSDQAQIRTG